MADILRKGNGKLKKNRENRKPLQAGNQECPGVKHPRPN
jgi:hypothetical protein